MNNKTQKNAYLTVTLSLIFGIILSLLLALIEGAAIGAARLQSEIVADLGLDSVFAEYNRELLDQYGLFFIDTSYGTTNSGIGMVESRLKDYMGYNLDPRNDNSYLYTKSMLLYLDNPYLEIERFSYATDDDALVWKSIACDYMISILGGDALALAQGYLDTVDRYGLDTMDVVEMVANEKKELDEKFSGNEVEEYDDDDSGYSYDSIISSYDDLLGGSLLPLVTPSGESVSTAVVEGGPYYSSRVKSGKINKGNGLHGCIDKADGIAYELLYNEYLMKTCGTYIGGKDTGMLKYQIEYIMFGCDNDKANLGKCVEMLVALRAAANMCSIMTDVAKKADVDSISSVICTVLLVPEATPSLSYLLLGLWSIAEAFSDVKIILDNGKVPLMKNPSDWNLSLIDMLSFNIFNGTKKDRGIGYNDYLRICINFINKDDKLNRSLDIVEMDIRQTKGNSEFRIDGCIDYMSVKFGFNDGYGHEFLINRSKCYE